jgi:hypothetical protein
MLYTLQEGQARRIETAFEAVRPEKRTRRSFQIDRQQIVRRTGLGVNSHAHRVITARWVRREWVPVLRVATNANLHTRSYAGESALAN